MRKRVEELVRASAELRRAFVSSKAFDADFLESADIVEMLRCVSARGGRVLRAFRDGSQDPRLVHRLLEHPPEHGEDLEIWLRRHAGPGPVGLVLDRPPLDGNDLDLRLSRWLEPVQALLGCPPGAIEAHVFVGDYGWTPFGMHHDDGVARVVHFHLGPSPKEIFVLGSDEFVALTGSTRSTFELERVTAAAQRFVLEPGDVFVLPTDGYHVGRTHGFCVAVALCLSDETARGFLGQAIQALAIERDADDEPLAWLRREPSEGLGRRGDDASDDGVVSVAEALAIRRALLLSNLGLEPLPELAPVVPLPETGGLVRVARFPLISVALGDEVLVCGRGRYLRLPHDPGLLRLLERLDAGAELGLESALGYLANFDEDAARYLLASLVSYRALAVTKA